MRIPAIALTLSVLGATGCTTLQTPPPAENKHIIKSKNTTEQLDLVQVQEHLSQFVEIVELLNRTKKPGKTDDVADTAAKPDTASGETATRDLDEIIKAINNNLEQLDNAKDDTATVRQMLAMADQFSGNKQNIFSGLFDIILRGASTKQSK